MKNSHPLLKSSARLNRLTMAVSLLWTSALASVVLISLASVGPAGNNGTIKVDNAPFDNAPNNEPHVACTFQIDFYGYDKGDLWADVIFEQQPPTDGGTMTVTGKTHVFIGEDTNAGGGSLAGLDASANYRLDFSGVTPQPQQGYHVKLTIHADGSQGADVKHKVFWVQPCAATATPTPAVTPKPTPKNTPRPSESPVVGGGTPTPTVKPSHSPSPGTSPSPSTAPGSPTPTATPGSGGGTPTPVVIGSGTPTPTPGVSGATPTPVVAGGGTPTPRPGVGNSSPTPAPTPVIDTDKFIDWNAPVELGAVSLPNVGSAVLLVSLILAALLSNILLVIWSIVRQREDRRRIQLLVDADDAE